MRKIMVICVSVFALILAACGGKATLTVTATDKGFDSTTYTVPAGAEVNVSFTNPGPVAHTFDILKADEHVTSYDAKEDEAKVLWELVALPGETKTGSFTAPTEPGEYEIICRVPGHIQMGMTATLVVK